MRQRNTFGLPTLSPLSAVAPVDYAPAQNIQFSSRHLCVCASSWHRAVIRLAFSLALSDGQSQASVGDEAGQGDPLVDVVAGNG